MTISNLLSTNVHVVVSILVSVCSYKHRMDYTTVHYMVHSTCYTLQTKSLFSHISWSQLFIKKYDLSHSWIMRSRYEHRYASFFANFDCFVPFSDSPGVVNLKISQFSVDNNDNDRLITYPLCMRAE